MMSRAAGTSMASPGSRKARCMSTTRRAVVAGASFSAASKASARSMINSALGGSSSVRPVRHLFSARLRLRLERSTWLSPRAVRWFLTGLDAIRQVLLTLRAVRPVFTVFEPSTQLSARLRLTSNNLFGPRLAFGSPRTIYSGLGSPSAHLELPCPHRKGVGDVADGFDPALVVDDDGDHVEAARLLAEPLRAQVALGELAELVLLPRVHGRLGRRRVLQIASGLDLDEDERFALLRHQVDLAHARPDVLLQDGVPATGQEAGRLVLPFDACELSCVSRHGSLLVRNDGKQVLLYDHSTERPTVQRAGPVHH